MGKEKENEYDKVIYPGSSFPQSHPDRLATIASLYGMSTPDIATCRVLELGCATGGNIIPMAVFYPEATFVGVDYSKVQIKFAQNISNKLGLNNLTFHEMSVMDISENFGEFDYIIVHGLLSWVHEDVKLKIIDICHDHLTENGVAYVSYNTYPGWHGKNIIRGMMQFALSKNNNKSKNLDDTLSFLEKIIDATPDTKNPFKEYLKDQRKSFDSASNWYLIHEYLEENNNPFYFYQFIELVKMKNLQYLGDAVFSSTQSKQLPQKSAKVLSSISKNRIELEQNQDFATNRSFRQSLLVSKNNNLSSPSTIINIVDLFITGSAKFDANVDLYDLNSSISIKLPRGGKVDTALPELKLMLSILSDK